MDTLSTSERIPESDGYSKKLEEARKLARSELSLDDWQRHKFCDVDMDAAFAEIQDNIQRINCKDFSTEEFIRHFETPSVPCIIEGLTDAWPAKSWTFDSLSQNYGGACLKCGEDDEGGKVKMSLAHFMRYLKEQSDDSPMYVFDEFGDGILPAHSTNHELASVSSL